METKNIETFFLNTLLRISIVGVFLILLSNLLFFPEDMLSISLAGIVLTTCIICYSIRHRYPTISVMIMASVVLAAMIYQRLASPTTTTSLSIVLIVGFIISVMLKGRLLWIMHTLTIIILNTVFIVNIKDPVTAAITYSTLYFILAYATGILKLNYDKMHQHLIYNNIDLHQKAEKIAAQNKELLDTHDNLRKLNMNLEKIVNERTARIQTQNEILIKYSYTNAHHLRGPVARLLGLASIYQLETQSDPDFFICKMVDQAHEIDSVVKQINVELALNNVELR
jgi:K+-sensing histidine kinase KdpD